MVGMARNASPPVVDCGRLLDDGTPVRSHAASAQPAVPCSARPRTGVHRRPPAVLVAVLAVVGAVVAAILPSPVLAAPGPQAGQRTLVLHLATAPAAPVQRAERAAALRGLLPAVRTRFEAEQALGRLGVRITGGDAASVRITGPAARLDRLFPRADSLIGAARRTPVELAASVSLVLDADDRRPVARARATLTGADLTSAYAVPLPGGYPRSRPTITAQTPVIASLQLSGWDNELLRIAASQQVFTADPGYDPIASGQYVGVGVDRAERWNRDTDDDEGDAEVALDQQAILAAAPAARQRAYFGTNSAQGYLAVLERVLGDVVAGVPIVAFSTSWGACEQTYSLTYLAQVERVFERLTAAGVTLFAASGDDGTRDCAAMGSDELAVDYPASSPSVLGVGGTTHPNGAGPALPDTAWSAPARGRGTGGGQSVLFARPSWQARSGSGEARQVPDFALPADIQDGFSIYTADHPGGRKVIRGPDPVGGTSLAAPLAAAMLTDTLIARGFPDGDVRGLGSIHRQLYAAAQDTPGAFTDVVAALANSPATIAPPGVGYDRATGLGTPDWTVLLGPLVAGPPPGLGRPGLSVPTRSTGLLRVGLIAPRGATVAAYYVSASDDGCRGTPLPGPTASLRVPEGVGKVYARALTTDLVCGPATSKVVTVPTDDRKALRRGSWSLRRTPQAFAKTYLQSSAAGATTSWTVTGRDFSVLVGTQRDGGLFDVLIDGRVVRSRVDTAAQQTRWAVPVRLSAPTRARHTVTVRVLGLPGRGSASTLVRVDGLIVVR